MPLTAPRRPIAALLIAVGLTATGLAPASAIEPFAAEPIEEPGTDVFDLQVKVETAATGSAPFDPESAPGLDASPADSILRSHDSVTYAVEQRLTGALVDNSVVIEHRLPEGLRWPDGPLPGICGDGSSVSDDRRDLTCVRADVQPNSVTTINLVANLAESQRQGFVLSHDADAILVSGQDSTTGDLVQKRITPAPLIVSSAPRINLGVARSEVVPGVTELDGTVGYYVPHSAYLSITGFNSDGGRGGRGASSPDGPVTFRIDLSGYTAGSRIASVNPAGVAVPAPCLVGAFSPDVFPGASGGGPGSVTDSGDWHCAPSEDGRSVDVTVSGADLTGDHIPLQSETGRPIASRGYLALGRFGVFVPETDVPESAGVPVVLAVDQLVANGSDVDGVVIPNAADDGSDNRASAVLAQRSGAGTHISRYVDRRTDNGLVPGQSTVGSGDAPVPGGQRFEQAVSWTNDNTSDALDGAIMCAVIDPKTQRVVERTNGSAPVETESRSGVGALIVEYGTRPTVDLDADDVVRQESLDAVRCDDGDDDWSTALPTNAEVTKVRVRPETGSIPARGAMTAWVQLEAKKRIAVGTPITETYSIKSSGNGPDRETPSAIVRDGWWHGVYRSQQGNNHYPRGDQLIASEAHLSITKRATEPAVEPGQPAAITTGGSIEFELSPVVVSQDNAGTRADDTTVVDLLPAGLVFDAESPSLRPASVESDAEGNTRLVWELGTIHAGLEPLITYRATAGARATGELVNRVLVGSPDDSTSLDDFPEDVAANNTHLSRQSVIVTAVTGLRIEKTSAQRAVEPGDIVEYLLTFANLSADQLQADVTVIDVLPYPGDVRGSTAQGRLHGAVDTLAETLYTHAPPALVEEFVQADSGDAFGRLPEGYRWCQEAEFGTVGCPSGFTDATAVRASLAELPPASESAIRYALATTGATSKDRFANDAVIHSSTQTLGTRSDVVETDVVTSTVGERIWWDTDEDGIDDDGQDGERGPGVAGAELQLSGTDKFGAAVERHAMTDDDGRYAFTELVSGAYEIAVTPDTDTTASFTRLRVGDDPLRNSAVDPETGVMAGIVIENPTATLEDTVDLRWNGGLIASDGMPPGPEVETGDRDLAQTGFDGVTALLVALAGLLLGTGIVVVRRRRAVISARPQR